MSLIFLILTTCQHKNEGHFYLVAKIQLQNTEDDKYCLYLIAEYETNVT